MSGIINYCFGNFISEIPLQKLTVHASREHTRLFSHVFPCSIHYSLSMREAGVVSDM